jgi:uncharacterized repeat protein (TIGR03803 family)
MKRRRLLAFGASTATVVLLTLLFATTAFAGPKYEVLHAFGKGKDGGGVWGSVALDNKGNLYGTTSGGGAQGYGTVFRLTPHANGQWTETVLHSFGKNDPGGCVPYGGPILDSVGNVYGTTVMCGLHHAGVAFELTRQTDGWKETVLHNFCFQSGCKDGSGPRAGLSWSSSSNLYGTAFNVFELSHSTGGWKEKVLYTFCSRSNCRDGADPYAGVIFEEAGGLYGTTRDGGTGCAGQGCGVVYEVQHTTSGWKEKVLHYFDNNGKDGYTPGFGALIMDGSGSLYGTTEVGGPGGSGTVFTLTPGSDGKWRETILRGFKQGADGDHVSAGVVMDKAGRLYGTTIGGGDPNCDCGVVYKLAPGSKGKWTYTVLHRFAGYDGAQPDANLILDDKGNLYGTTATGGADGAGVVFEVTP